MEILCKKCGSGNYVKAGFVGGAQRYRCLGCGCQFVPAHTKKGRPARTKRIAALLRVCGLPLRTVGQVVHADASTVLKWSRQLLGGANEPKKSPPGEPSMVVASWEGICRFMRSDEFPPGTGKLVVAMPVNLRTGDIEGMALLHFQDQERH